MVFEDGVIDATEMAWGVAPAFICVISGYGNVGPHKTGGVTVNEDLFLERRHFGWTVGYPSTQI